jgi:hypothetical protein
MVRSDPSGRGPKKVVDTGMRRGGKPLRPHNLGRLLTRTAQHPPHHSPTPSFLPHRTPTPSPSVLPRAQTEAVEHKREHTSAVAHARRLSKLLKNAQKIIPREERRKIIKKTKNPQSHFSCSLPTSHASSPRRRRRSSSSISRRGK